MAIFKQAIETSLLERLLPINQLDKPSLAKLAQQTFIEKLNANKTLFLGGQSSRWKWYLLEGKVNLRSKNGGVKQISGTEPEALRPLDTLIRDLDSASSATDIRFIKIDTIQLKKLLADARQRSAEADMAKAAQGAKPGKSSITFLPDPEPEEELEENNDLDAELERLLDEGELPLPSIPGDALQIASAISKPNQSAKTVATELGQNPEISKLVLRISNNAVFRGEIRIATVSNAVMRLGVDSIKNVVIGAGMRKIFHSPIPPVKRYLKPLWQESAEVAATAKVLATLTGKFKPDNALLAGLLHQVGKIVILNVAANMGEIIYDVNTLQHAFDKYSGEIGAAMLRKWRFPEEFINVCMDYNNLLRDKSDEADLCDLIMLCRIHCNPRLLKFNGQKLMTKEIPAYAKFDLAPPKIEGRIGELVNEERQLAEAKALLSN